MTNVLEQSRVTGGFGRLIFLFIPVFALLSSFLGFVQYHEFAVWHPAVLLAGLILIAAGLVIGLPIAIWPTSIGFVVCIALILAFLMLQSPQLGISSIVLLFQHNAMAAVIGAIAVLALVLLAWRARQFVPLTCASIFGMICLAVVLLPPDRIETGTQYQRDHAFNSAAPPIIHIVLDEHIGIEGIPADIPGSEEFRQELKAFYQRHGFRLYGGAFSHWSQTQYALGSTLNAQMVPDGLIRRSQDPRADFSLTENRWFDKLSGEGFDIRVYQTDYLDLCLSDASHIKSCHISPANSISLLQPTGLPTSQRARIMLESFFESLARGLGVETEPRHRLGAIAGPEVLTGIVRDLAQAPRGTAIFAHVLIPHQSYVYDPGCNLKQEVSKWMNSAEAVTWDLPANTPESRRERYVMYFEQVRCTHKLLGDFFQELQKIGVFDEATIILHGDHGSRIGLFSPASKSSDDFSDADVVDHFSTLYAVKRPGEAPAYDPQLRSIQALFSESFLDRDLSDSGPFIFLNDYSPKSDDQPTRAPMPESSAAPIPDDEGSPHGRHSPSG